LGVSIFIYVALVYQAMLKKGKVPSIDISTAARAEAGCSVPASGLDRYYLGPLPLHQSETPIRYGDSNPFRLESFWPEIFDLRVLSENPVCFNAYILDELSSSSNIVIYIYDKGREKAVYKISNIRSK
jgi:hypothetical protein